MNQKSCFSEFIRYTIFSVFGTLGVSCYILADTFFVSKGLGADGLTALNLAIPVYNFIHGTGLMVGMGAATRFSICKSQRKKEEVHRIYTNSIYFAAAASAVFFLAGLFLAGDLAGLLGADADTLQMTETYLRWLLIFAPAFIFNDVFLCFVRNDESPQLSMAAMLTGSFANIVLDYIFIFPMEMGIFGAVFATGLSPVISMVMMLPHWIRKKNTFHFKKTKISGVIVGQTAALGFPSLVAQLSSGIVMITLNTMILKLEGNTGVAAYGVIANLSLVLAAVYTGIAQGIQPLISSFHGKQKNAQLFAVRRYAMITMAVISCLVYSLFVIFAQPIVSAFNSEHLLGLQEIAVKGLKLYFTASLFMGYNIVLATFFTSVERAVPAHILSVLRGIVLIIPVAVVLEKACGMTGVWLACPITELVVAVLGAVYYLIYQRKIKLITKNMN
ncbi:Multidrug export protein mepA [uncultured Roseburia sp.]|uniref:Multidrug export protein MepA n=1 Tax=Brotonthovivens ammoniilytica TaxID=2981725 RepID=A0ABT2THV3_9FIRM|nr:MATE family efflux transporter [Brotonthovivens ammoniilytica]MCU6761441.1 MATE family efflux transporter [Brotonthovivens ammoniilytica]SCI28508.1 Multidrug export protein mepA [uncultured Roseburia sp.]